MEAVFTRRAFLAHATVGSDACQLFLPGAPSLVQATPLAVRVRFGGEPLVFSLEGSVLRAESRGLLMGCEGPQLPAFSRLHAYARGVVLEWGRRNSERIPVAISTALGPEGSPLGRGTIVDLSRGGARVRVAAAGPIHAGDTLDWVARLGLFRKLRAQVRVAWVQRSGEGLVAGLEFKHMEPADRLALAQLLANLRR